MAAQPLIIERTFRAKADSVWQAITDVKKMKEWYFDLDGFKPEVGFEFQFTGKGTKGEQYLHLCKVTEVVPGKKISYSWKYKDYPGQSLLTWELFPEGDHTRLKLTHAGLETFPQDSPDFAITSFTAGWTSLMGSLNNYLEKQTQKVG